MEGNENVTAPERSLTGLEVRAQSLMERLEEELTAVPSDQRGRAAAMHLEIARLAEEVFADFRKAFSHLKAAHDLMPDLLPTLRTLRRLHHISGNSESTVRLVDEEFRVTKSDQLKSVLCYEKGRLQTIQRLQPTQALQSFERALEFDPTNRDALSSVIAINAMRNDWVKLNEALSRMANLTQDPAERSRITAMMAEIHELYLGREEEAQSLYAMSLSFDSTNWVAIEALKRLTFRSGRWPDLAAVLLRESELTESLAQKHSDLYQAGRLFRWHLSDHDEAVEHLERASSLIPGDTLALTELEEIYASRGQHDLLIDVLKRRLIQAIHRGEEGEILFRIGTIYEESLGRLDEAVGAYQAALEASPLMLPALHALRTLFLREGRHEELVELELSRVERVVDPARRAERYIYIAEIMENRLGLMEDAVRAYQIAFELQPGFPLAFHALDRIFNASGRYGDLVSLYEDAAAKAKDPRRHVDLLRKVAMICEEALKDAPRAIGVLYRVLDMCAEDIGSLAALERLLSVEERWEDLVAILSRHARITTDEDEALALLLRMGEVVELRLGDQGRALDAYGKLLSRSPTFVPALKALQRLHLEAGRYQDLVGAYRREVELSSESEDAAILLVRIGQILEQKLGQEEEAVDAFEAALVKDPTYVPALQCLERIHTLSKRWDRLVDVLDRQSRQMTRPGRRAVALVRIGEIQEERLDNREAALASYEQALQLDPTSGPAQRGIVRIHEAKGDWQRLADVYLNEVTTGQDLPRRRRAALSLGRLWACRFNEPRKALKLYDDLLEARADDGEVLWAVEQTARRVGDGERLLQVLPALIAQSSGPAPVSLLKEQALLLEAEGREQEFVVAYQEVLRRKPDDWTALWALEAQASQGNKENLMALLPMLLDQETSDAMRSFLLSRLADLLLAKGRPQETIDALKVSLSLAGDRYDLLHRLRQLQLQAGRIEEAAALLLREGRAAASPTLAVEAFSLAGDLYLDEFNRREEAKEAYRLALSLNPLHSRAFERAIELSLEAGESAEVVSAYRARVGATIGKAERVKLLLELATHYRVRMEERTPAIRTLLELLALEPSHSQALEMLGTLYSEEARWSEAVDTMTKVIATAADETMLRRVRLRAARILHERLFDQDRAVALLRQVLQAQPSDEEALRALGAIEMARGGYAVAAQCLEALAPLVKTVERAAILLDLACLHEKQLRNPRAAMRFVLMVLDLSLEDREAYQILEDFFGHRGDWEGLASLLMERCEDEPLDRVAQILFLRMALADLLATRMDRPEEAEIELNKAIPLAPDNPEPLVAKGRLVSRDIRRLEEARAILLEAQRMAPFLPGAYRGLMEVFERREERDAYAMSASCLVALGEATEKEAKAADRISVLPLPSRPLGASDLWDLMPDGPYRAAWEIFGLVDEYLGKVIPPDLEAYGLIRDDLFTPRLDAPLQRLMDEVGALFGCVDLHFCLSNERPLDMGLLQNEHPVLVIGSQVPEVMTPEVMRFEMGRRLCRIRAGTVSLAAFTDEEVEAVLLAVASLHAEHLVEKLRERGVFEFRKRVQKVLPRKVRKGLEAPVQRLLEFGMPKGYSLRKHAALGANRAGLIACGNLAAVVQSLVSREEGTNPSGVNRNDIAKIRHDDAAGELLRFALSPSYLKLRRELGLGMR